MSLSEAKPMDSTVSACACVCTEFMFNFFKIPQITNFHEFVYCKKMIYRDDIAINSKTAVLNPWPVHFRKTMTPSHEQVIYLFIYLFISSNDVWFSYSQYKRTYFNYILIIT